MPQKQLQLINGEATEASPNVTEITDPDLLKQLEQLQNLSPKLRKMSESRLIGMQEQRNATAEKRAEMTPVERRRDIVKETRIENPIEQDDIRYVHSVLALCALPYRKPPDDLNIYTRSYGHMSLSVQAGVLGNPETGEAVRQGLPYGPKARLLHYHICSLALYQKSPEIELEDSLSAFIRSMGFDIGGGKKGSFNAFKEQLNRLAASRNQMVLWNGDRAKTINTNPISEFDVWLPPNPDQKMLWNSRITLSLDFYESLKKHALPVDYRVVSALSHSAKQMDILSWLSYRLRSLRKPYFLTWDVIKDQFCQSNTQRMDHFQNYLKEDFADIEEIFDKALPLKLSDKGITLLPCDPSDYFVPPKKPIR